MSSSVPFEGNRKAGVWLLAFVFVCLKMCFFSEGENNFRAGQMEVPEYSSLFRYIPYLERDTVRFGEGKRKKRKQLAELVDSRVKNN